uniref:SFRICE_002957 n=1 Tax=Spodoptera frugiperda TaxID=7108 RepID=A0A2H1WH56_SPOFR
MSWWSGGLRRSLLMHKAQLARWLGNWPCNVLGVRFPHRITLCVIHKLLFRLWVSYCVCELGYLVLVLL